MNTGISRFVLFSAALHLGLLSAASFNWTKPHLMPAALSVTLDEPSATAAASFNRTHILTRRLNSEATMPADGKAAADSSAPFPDETKREGVQRPHIAADDASFGIQNKSSSDLPPTSSSLPTGTGRSGEETTGSAKSNDPRSGPVQENAAENQTRFPSPPVSRRPVEPDEGAGTPDSAEQSAVRPDQRLDAAMLASQLEGQLRTALAPYFAYPLLARRNGWQGQVEVGLRVESDGRLSHVRIAHSSGYRALDGAALSTLSRINAIPEAAGWLDGRHFDMVLPIDYRLIDGQS